ncbi:hypothetical protein [Candidatus Accumulibacter vicinus]|uniref:CHAT domain-containing protein n=1 Tax=Candidatus Accumulibacter vicinus TaxID=2954382 RepID=A0A084XYT2_9PROT|nr:hypothetical protein [Candidatus Accumulibacter vicinus]KFB67626.1 MAG: hypothetical protein CAPSK01_003069 [Candidatus Accumulibacter vicinus]
MNHMLPFVALWREDRAKESAALHLLTRDTHRKLPLPNMAEPPQAVEAFLPELLPVMPSPNPAARWLLLLEPSLPQSWQHLRWEALALGGRPLAAQALVIRRATWHREETSTHQPARFLDLFPPAEFSFLDRFQPLIQSERLRRSRASFIERDLAATGDFIIVAHGRSHGLVDADGNSFALPVAHPMPERIWLLACNVDRAMGDLAQKFLNQGCRTVIVATGDISAPEMAGVVESVFAGTRLPGENRSWLARARAAFDGAGNPLALTIWGECDIDPTACAAWNRMTWDDEHGNSRRPPLDDETTRDEFLAAYQHATSPQAWPLTRDWMLPPLLWLAEKHDHPAMRDLSTQLGDAESPAAIRGLASAARRVGNYAQMARYLSRGLQIPDLTVNERAEYLGALANLFIDMNLPESAAAIIEFHQDCLWDDPENRYWADFKRLDWLARMEARRGRLHLALDYMTAKRRQARTDSGRELAWQLYLATWGYLAGQVRADTATAFADEVAQRLAGSSSETLGNGNETVAYLLRALAAHAWVSHDSAQLTLAKCWLSHAEARLTDDDPGPWAYAIAYSCLQGAAPPLSLDRALCALERARYLLEAACLSGFAGRGDERRRLLDRFQQRRKGIFGQLDESVGTAFATDLVESATRAVAEINADDPGSAARLGTMPL